VPCPGGFCTCGRLFMRPALNELSQNANYVFGTIVHCPRNVLRMEYMYVILKREKGCFLGERGQSGAISRRVKLTLAAALLHTSSPLLLGNPFSCQSHPQIWPLLRLSARDCFLNINFSISALFFLWSREFRMYHVLYIYIFSLFREYAISKICRSFSLVLSLQIEIFLLYLLLF